MFYLAYYPSYEQLLTNRRTSMTGIQDYQMLIDGVWVDAADGAAFDSINPATGQVWARIPEATAAGIFTRNSARSLRVSKAVRAGIVWVNTYRGISPVAEFGGMKTSDHDRESGFQAVLDYTHPKTVWMNTSSDPLTRQFHSR